MVKEFELLHRFVRPLDKIALNSDLPIRIACGQGDDAAVIALQQGALVLSVDTQIEGVHFPWHSAAQVVVQRSLCAALSDLAAMGAEPAFCTLALTLSPQCDERWLQQMGQSLNQLLHHYALPLIGGDTTYAQQQVLSWQVHGWLPQVDCGLSRQGAQVGDTVYVSGYLGDAAAALVDLNQADNALSTAEQYLRQRYQQPTPRLALGQALRTLATSAIDISDGLVADLTHICRASQVQAQIALDRLPLSSALQAVCARDRAYDYALGGGDDYELCFTAGPQHQLSIQVLAQQLGLPITPIGQIMAPAPQAEQQQVKVMDAQGQHYCVSHKGFEHGI